MWHVLKILCLLLLDRKETWFMAMGLCFTTAYTLDFGLTWEGQPAEGLKLALVFCLSFLFTSIGLWVLYITLPIGWEGTTGSLLLMPVIFALIALSGFAPSEAEALAQQVNIFWYVGIFLKACILLITARV